MYNLLFWFELYCTPLCAELAVRRRLLFSCYLSEANNPGSNSGDFPQISQPRCFASLNMTALTIL